MEDITRFELNSVKFTKLEIGGVIVYITTYMEMRCANPSYDRDVMIDKLRISTGNWLSQYHTAELADKLNYNDNYLSEKSGDRWEWKINDIEHILLVMK